MKDKKAIIDLEDAIKDSIYRQLSNEIWERVELFRQNITMELDRLATQHSKRIAKELLEQIEIKQKKR